MRSRYVQFSEHPNWAFCVKRSHGSRFVVHDSTETDPLIVFAVFCRKQCLFVFLEDNFMENISSTCFCLLLDCKLGVGMKACEIFKRRWSFEFDLAEKNSEENCAWA